MHTNPNLPDAITLECELDCIVGILARERREPQRLRASFELELDLEPCASSGDLGKSLDYARIDGMFRTLAGHGGFLLLETLALAAVRWILLPPGSGEARGHVEQATLHITKPEVLPGSLPGVRLTRRASALPVETRTLAQGVTARVLADLDEVTALRVEVRQGHRWSPPAGAVVFPEPGEGGVHGPAMVLVVEAREHAGLC